MRGVYHNRRCQPPATHPNCASYSYTVRACLIVTVHGSILCTDPLRPARRSTYPLMGDTAGFSLLFSALQSIATYHLKPFYSRICQQNTDFNMYTEICKRKQGSPCKNSHQRCFETTNFDRLHREELLFVPRYTHRLNSFSSTITQQNTHFNMYIETSKQQQGFPCKNSHQKCFRKDKF